MGFFCEQSEQVGERSAACRKIHYLPSESNSGAKNLQIYERTSDIVLLSHERQLTSQLDIDKIIDDFSAQQSRRIKFKFNLNTTNSN